MTVPATPQPRAELVGDGVAVDFDFTFPYFPATLGQTLNVIRAGVAGAAHSESVNAEQESEPGGTVTFLVAPIAGESIIIERVTPTSQLLDLNPMTPITQNGLEAALDKIVMMVQEAVARFVDSFGDIFNTINTWFATQHFEPPPSQTGVEVTASGTAGIAVSITNDGLFPGTGVSAVAQGNADGISGRARVAGYYGGRFTSEDGSVALRLAVAAAAAHAGTVAELDGRIEIAAPATSGGVKKAHIGLAALSADPAAPVDGDAWRVSAGGTDRLKGKLGGNVYDLSDRLRFQQISGDVVLTADDIGKVLFLDDEGFTLTLPNPMLTKAGRIDVLAPYGGTIDKAVGSTAVIKAIKPGFSSDFTGTLAGLLVGDDSVMSLIFTGDGTVFIIGPTLEW